MAGLGHRSDVTERPLISVLQSSTREGPLRIIEPPFLAADRSAVDAPKRTDESTGCCHSDLGKLTVADSRSPFVIGRPSGAPQSASAFSRAIAADASSSCCRSAAGIGARSIWTRRMLPVNRYGAAMPQVSTTGVSPSSLTPGTFIRREDARHPPAQRHTWRAVDGPGQRIVDDCREDIPGGAHHFQRPLETDRHLM